MAAGEPSHRRARLIVAASLVFLAAVALVGLLYIRPKVQRLHRLQSDAALCTSALTSLQLLPPYTGTGVPTYGFRASRTTAGQIADDLARTNTSAHPWDKESRDTPAVRCKSGNVTWVADRNGHAARLPTR